MIQQSIAEAGIEECCRSWWKCVRAFKSDLPPRFLRWFTYIFCLKVFCAAAIMLANLTSVVLSLLSLLAGRTCMLQHNVRK